MPRPFPIIWAFFACFFWISVAFAQTEADAGPDPAEWENVASGIERALEQTDIPTTVLDRLRLEASAYRQVFLDEQEVNAERVETLRSQIEALGSIPEEGAPAEPEEITLRRNELTTQLSELEAPRLRADESFQRADGLIAEIDAAVRARQTDALLQLGPSPLDFRLWPDAILAMSTTTQNLISEVGRNWNNTFRRDIFRENAPVTLSLLLLALLLLWQGQSFLRQAGERAYGRIRSENRDLVRFGLSLGQFVIPVLGLVVLSSALTTSGIVGPTGRALAEQLPLIGLCVFGARWLAAGLFPVESVSVTPIQLPDDSRAEGHWYGLALGILVAINFVLGTIATFPEHTTETIAVVSFPVAALSGAGLFCVALLLLRAARSLSAEQDNGGFRVTVLRLGGRAILLAGLIGPILSAIGYFTAAEALIFPTILSLALVALLATIHTPIRDFYALATGLKGSEADEALVPVLITFALTILTVPVFALIWGARVVDLAEIWARFQEGFSLGGSRIAPTDILTFIIVFAIGFAATRIIQGTLRSAVLPKTRIDIGGQTAIVSGLGYVGIFIAALIAITSTGLDLSNLAILAGALSVGIGFGLQNIVSNFVSGIILLIERPISEGDWIEVGGQMGIVKDISVRSTRIETFDRTDVIVPNAEFVSGTVTNWTRGNNIGRVRIAVGVSYSADSEKVDTILREICEAHPMVSMNPPPAIYFRNFGADSLEFECLCVLRDVNFILRTQSELNHQIHARFRGEGIEIPFAQRDIWLRNPEALTGAPNTDQPE